MSVSSRRSPVEPVRRKRRKRRKREFIQSYTVNKEEGGRRRKEEGGGSLFKSTAVTEEDAEWNWAKLAPRALGQGRGSR
jgi:hypothetical protein